MSRQIDFYAHPDDVPTIERIIRRSLGNYFTTEDTRGAAPVLIPQERPLPPGCEKSEVFGPTLCIVPPWAVQRIHTVPTNRASTPGELIIDTHDNPVLEYRCSFFDTATRVVDRGRFYWSFLGQLQDEHLKSIERLFRGLRAASERLEGSNFLRVFPKAKELAGAYVLNPGVAPTPSPYK
jgi:hypothetical protein